MVKVGGLWEDPSDQSDRILDGALLPAVEGFAEIGFGPQDLVHAYVFDVFFAVVVCDRSAHCFGIPREDARHRDRCVACCSSGDLGDLDIAGLAFDQHAEPCFSFACFNAIAFPVAILFALLDHLRALMDRNTLWNMAHSMRMAMSLALPMTMGACQTRDQVLFPARAWRIDVLIDCFVTDRYSVARLLQRAGDLLRRPASSQMLVDIGSKPSTLKSRPTTSSSLADCSTQVSTATAVGVVELASVTTDLARDRTNVTTEALSDLSEGHALGPIDGQAISLPKGELEILWMCHNLGY